MVAVNVAREKHSTIKTDAIVHTTINHWLICVKICYLKNAEGVHRHYRSSFKLRNGMGHLNVDIYFLSDIIMLDPIRPDLRLNIRLKRLIGTRTHTHTHTYTYHLEWMEWMPRSLHAHLAFGAVHDDDSNNVQNMHAILFTGFSYHTCICKM